MEEVFFRSRSQNLGVGAQQRECNVATRVFHHGLAGESKITSEELLGLGRRGEAFLPGVDLDDALVAVAHPSTGGRHPDRKFVGIVEDRFAGNQWKPAAARK